MKTDAGCAVFMRTTALNASNIKSWNLLMLIDVVAVALREGVCFGKSMKIFHTPSQEGCMSAKNNFYFCRVPREE